MVVIVVVGMDCEAKEASLLFAHTSARSSVVRFMLMVFEVFVLVLRSTRGPGMMSEQTGVRCVCVCVLQM